MKRGELYVIQTKGTPFKKLDGEECEFIKDLYKEHALVVILDTGREQVIHSKYLIDRKKYLQKT